ncbi:11598_t:CDS:2 [Ambispora leptoticha]|uniref:11598_t:CDS:1 n=1 Tax=Ambispora leptoticha TaxID=144679 RepID=A0A9N9FLC6_9GLOM|nr:11598_t:CDS:2 [Ambispora leptoticha]
MLYIHCKVREIQSGSLKVANLEAWFNCHVWNVVFDQAFGDVNAISVVRGESTSLASASRKNIKRLSGERRKMGRRIDWILRSISNGDRDEFGAGEAGKSWVDKNGTKFLKEAGLKLPKTLKDMLVKLMEKAGWDEESRAKIQTVGIIHAGLMIMTVYLDNPKGYICRVRRGELMEVPDNAENFPYILTILASVLNIKAVVQEIIKAVQAKKQTVKSFKRAGFRKRPLDKNEDRISPCLSTPKKAKVCAEAYTEKSYPSSPCPGSPSQRSDLFSYLE